MCCLNQIPDLHDDKTVVEIHGRKYVRADKLEEVMGNMQVHDICSLLRNPFGRDPALVRLARLWAADVIEAVDQIL